MWRALLLLAACGAPKDPDHARRSFDGAAGASDDRSAFAYIDEEDRLVVITAERTRAVPRPVCMARPQQLFVAPGGVAVGAYGAHRQPGDLWGHGGKTVTASCVVDLATGGTSTLPGPDRLVWFGPRLVGVPPEQLPLAGACATATTSGGPLAVCVDGPSLAVRRYRDDTFAHDADAIATLASPLANPRLRIAPDGKRVALWDAATLLVIDLATGAVVMTYADLGKLETVEIDPTGGDRVMLVGAAYEVGESPDHRIRVVGFDGKLHEARSEPGADRTVYWTDTRAYWSTTTSRVDRRALAP